MYPRFVVQFHSDNFTLDERVKQPSEVKIFASQLFIFKTPVQNEDNIRDIYLSGGKIFLEAFRPKDRASSLVKHEFEFKAGVNILPQYGMIEGQFFILSRKQLNMC